MGESIERTNGSGRSAFKIGRKSTDPVPCPGIQAAEPGRRVGPIQAKLSCLCLESGKITFAFSFIENCTIAQEEDLEYLQLQVKDFLERAKREPAALFNQLSSLGMGSLVTQEVGSNLADDSSLQTLLKLCRTKRGHLFSARS